MERELRERLDRALYEDETLLWSGMPEPGLHFLYGDETLIPMYLGIAGVVLYIIHNAPPSVESGKPLLWIFLAVALYFIFVRQLLAAWFAPRTMYAVTDQRVIYMKGTEMRSVSMAQIPYLEKKIKRNGLGHVVMEKAVYASVTVMRGRRRTNIPKNLFQNIREVDKVYLLISNQRMNANKDRRRFP